MKLYCVRHGEAQPVDVDPQCGLSVTGKEDVTAVAQQLHSQQLYIPHILHSSKLRAVQTAQIFAQALGVEQVTETETLLDVDAEVQPLLEMIHSWNQDTMLVGHMPFMEKLVSALVIGDENNYPIVNFLPGTVICLEFNEQRRWVINWLLRPSIVRALRR